MKGNFSADTLSVAARRALYAAGMSRVESYSLVLLGDDLTLVAYSPGGRVVRLSLRQVEEFADLARRGEARYWPIARVVRR